ncbi:MAG: flagellar motor switch protein FliN [Rhizobiaceae bacterium]
MDPNANAVPTEGDEEDQLSAAIDELRDVLHEGASATEEGIGMASFSAAAATHENHGVIMDIPVDVQIVLGSTEMPVSELMALQKGSTVALDRRIGEPVDVVVNGRKIASGEVTVLENDPSRFGIKLTHIVDSSRQG